MAKPAVGPSELVRGCIDLGLRLRQALAAALEPFGVTPEQQELLRQLVAGRQSPGELVVATGRDKTTLSRVIARAVALGLVERAVDDRDKRRQVLRATARGAQVYEHAERAVEREAAQLLESLSPRQRRRLGKTLRRLGSEERG